MQDKDYYNYISKNVIDRCKICNTLYLTHAYNMFMHLISHRPTSLWHSVAILPSIYIFINIQQESRESYRHRRH